MRIKKSLINEYIYFFYTISVLVFSFYFRERFLNEIAQINFIFILATIGFILINFKRMNYIIIFLLINLSALICIIDINNSNSLETILRNYLITIFPLFILGIRIDEKTMKKVFVTFVKILNLLILILLFIGIIDPFINYKIMYWIVENITLNLQNWVRDNTIYGVYRYTSFMGHSLFTKELFIIFYLLNKILIRKYNICFFKERWIDLISLIGVLLTGSKVGVFSIIFCIFFIRSGKEKYNLNIILSLITLIGLFFMGFFDTVIYRLLNESLTTGRYEAAQVLNNLNLFDIKLFYGYGENLYFTFINTLSEGTITAALEYPIKILFYKYGIITTIIYISIIFIYPFLIFLKKKDYFNLLCFLILVIEINTYNGLIMKPDNLIIYVIVVNLMIYSSRHDILRRFEEGGNYEKSRCSDHYL